jgi:hypothetical protein
MRKFFTMMALTIATLTLCGAAYAQQVRVQVNINTFVPVPSEDQTLKAQEQSRRMIYDLAGHECALLRETIASDCQLATVNVNIQRSQAVQFPGQQRPDGFNVNAKFRLSDHTEAAIAFIGCVAI